MFRTYVQPVARWKMLKHLAAEVSITSHDLLCSPGAFGLLVAGDMRPLPAQCDSALYVVFLSSVR